eukprot:jgi/Chlat1/5686/Chrsp374S05465
MTASQEGGRSGGRTGGQSGAVLLGISPSLFPHSIALTAGSQGMRTAPQAGNQQPAIEKTEVCSEGSAYASSTPPQLPMLASILKSLQLAPCRAYAHQ